MQSTDSIGSDYLNQIHIEPRIPAGKGHEEAVGGQALTYLISTVTPALTMASETGCIREHRVSLHRPQLKTQVENKAWQEEGSLLKCLLVQGTVLGAYNVVRCLWVPLGHAIKEMNLK